MNTTNTTAYEYGKAAYTRGAMCVPAHDGEFLKTLNSIVGSNIKALKDWQRGWVETSLRDDSNLPAGFWEA